MDTYTTPEGFELARPLRMPQARTFADVLTYVREWDHNTMSHRNGVVPRPELVPAATIVDGNQVGPFCWIRNAGPRSRGVAVTITDATAAALAGRIVTDDDRLSIQVIVHKENNRALVLAQHNHIIGSHWLAYIDPDTIPDPPKEG